KATPVQYAAPSKKWRRLSALAETSQNEEAQSQSGDASEIAADASVSESEESAVRSETISEAAEAVDVDSQTETEDERDLKKRTATYVVPMVPVAKAAPLCTTGKSCPSLYHAGCVGSVCGRYLDDIKESQMDESEATLSA
ncbi:hypothetical protein CSUI_002807, partial [Cystoisospora suis]